ncbi:MAG: hypothetical protein V7L23_13195 [Nostoc sp.]|uniref:hypothetical protein n=1 Tax=Nostoc sp. TaxID=1180 RepID=UPI002FF15437
MKITPTATSRWLEFVPGMPEDYGTYLFLFSTGKVREGEYGSFPYPYHNHCVKVANFEEERFYYYGQEESILGWYEECES